jgi:hypothetical protein
VSKTEIFLSPPLKIFYDGTVYFIWCSFTKPEKKSTDVIPVRNWLQSGILEVFIFGTFSQLGVEDFDDVLLDDEPNTNGVVDQYAPDFEAFIQITS